MILIEVEDTSVWTGDLPNTNEGMSSKYEHIAINTVAINSIADCYPHGCIIHLSGDFTRIYHTKESYATILAKIKDAEDDYYFRNCVIRHWEDKQEGK